MNIYESMNNYFNDKLAAVERSTKLTESVEKSVVEFEEIVIPAPFDTYYRVIRPEEYEDILGFEYDVDEIKSEANEYGVEELQYAILKDGFDTDGEVEVVAICKDGEDNIFVGINVGGNMYPVDFDEVEGEIKKNEKPVEEAAEIKKAAKRPLKEYFRPRKPVELTYSDLAHIIQVDADRVAEALSYFLENDPRSEGLDEDGIEEWIDAKFNTLVKEFYPNLLDYYRDEAEAEKRRCISQERVGAEEPIDVNKCRRVLRHDIDWDDTDPSFGGKTLEQQLKSLYRDGEIDSDERDYILSHLEELLQESEQKVESIKESAGGLNPWDKLVKAFPELADGPAEEPIRESAEDGESDLWDKVYGELTMDGELVPSSTGKSYKFNAGAGYRYADQVWTGEDGEICVGAESVEELEAAARVAEGHKEDGVSYKLRKGSPNRDKFPFIIEISVPYEEE